MPEKMNLPSLSHNCLVKVRNGNLHSEGSKFQKLSSFITKCFLKPNQTAKENIKKSLCQFPLSRSIMGISKQFGISNLLERHYIWKSLWLLDIPKWGTISEIHT